MVICYGDERKQIHGSKVAACLIYAVNVRRPLWLEWRVSWRGAGKGVLEVWWARCAGPCGYCVQAGFHF